MKVALIHEHLAQDGGAEKVLKYLLELYPNSPVFVLVHDKDRANPFFQDKKIITSFIQNLPFGVKHYKCFLPLMPMAVEGYDLKGYDVVISSSSALAKGVICDPGTLHICYCHTPTRYIWNDRKSYVEELSYNYFVKKVIPLYLHYLRMWDQISSNRVDEYIANSSEVQKRIQKYYRRKSTIIYPSVELDRFSIGSKIGNYFLAGGRLVPYKRFDLIVQAFNKLGLPLKIFGDGPALESLKKLASSKSIEFLGRVSDEEKARLYRECKAFIHPQVEDFGIVIVEVMASGRPVIAFGEGGALEIIKPGVSGIFFENQTWECLAETIIRFKHEAFDPIHIQQEAARFDVKHFKRSMKNFVEKKYQEFLTQKA